jgi:prepilin-type N-terminal cleavage/methylation domain-containing protein
MSSKSGFTLIESVVALLIGAAVIVAIGGLSERLIHHRTTTDSNSAALNLAEWQMEKLFASSARNLSCPTATTSSNACGSTVTNGDDLCGYDVATNVNGRQHGPVTIDANQSSGGRYCLQWNVLDASSDASSPLIVPTGVVAKRITVTVRHQKNPQVYAKVTSLFPPP